MAARTSNTHGRAGEARVLALLELVEMSLKEDACVLQKLIESGELSERVVHNDTKISNVLFAAG